MFKKTLSILCAVFFFGIAVKPSFALYQSIPTITPTPSIDYTLPYPGLLPTHPLYFVKHFRDRILLAMTRNPLKKSEYLLLFSDKHLAMGKLLVENKSEKKGSEILITGENYLNSSLDRLSESKEKGVFPPGYIQKIELSAKKHKEVLNQLLSIVSDSASLSEITEALSINSKAFVKISELYGSGK